jgi:hypothetical protein
MSQMPLVFLRSCSPAELITLGLSGVLVVLVTAMGWRTWRASRISPEEIERRRRKALIANGKMGDATLVEFRDNLIFYSYDVRGIEYMASQDVSSLKDSLPPDPDAVVGPVCVRYDARNPANSIIVGEEWSGIRSPRT